LPFDLPQGGEFIEPRSLRETQSYPIFLHGKFSKMFG